MSISTDESRVLPEVAMTDELAAAIQAAISTADVKSLLVAEAEKQLATKTQLDSDQAAATQAAADKIAADQAEADAVAKANQIFSRTEIIGGREFHFEASTEGELDRQVLNAFKVAYNVQQPETRAEVVDPNAAAQAAEAETLAKVELERKFKLGEISAADYIQQSGAVNEYLSKQGISIDSLKAVVENNRVAATQQSWAEASEIFRNSPAGESWPGGEKNRALLGDKLAALGLVDAEDKVAALSQAYAAMKQTGAYFVNGDEPITTAADVASSRAVVAEQTVVAQQAEQTRAAAAAKVRSMSSSLFGASSGTSGAPVTSPAVVDAKKAIPDNATPQEILEAWKAAQVAGGQDPNAAFTAAFRAKQI
jgi:hypothetical protein